MLLVIHLLQLFSFIAILKYKVRATQRSNLSGHRYQSAENQYKAKSVWNRDTIMFCG